MTVSRRLYKYSAFLLIPLTTFLISQWYIQLMLVQGESMAPAYRGKQIVFLYKHTDAYTVGTVVAFRCDALNCVLVKRIAAAPGDSVSVKDSRLYINGKEYYNCRWDISDTEEILLNENEYFMVGDNFQESVDSRDTAVSIVNGKDLIGVIIPNKKFVK